MKNLLDILNKNLKAANDNLADDRTLSSRDYDGL